MKCIRNFTVILIVLSVLYNCKNEKKKDLITTDYFDKATNLNTLRNYNEVKINDSITRISGLYSHYIVKGFINANKQKTDWWYLIDKKQGDKTNVKIEYRIIDNKSIINQFIFYTNQKGIYKVNSKFYKSASDSSKNIILYFYTPNVHTKKTRLATFTYFLYSNGREIEYNNLDCKEDKGFYSVNIKKNRISNQKIILKGLFTEIFKDELGRVAQNEIYVLDTIQ